MRLAIGDLLVDNTNEIIWTVNCNKDTHPLYILKKVNDYLIQVGTLEFLVKRDNEYDMII